MTATRKRFDRDLFQLYDQQARDVTTKYLQAQGYRVAEHPDRYAQDLIAYGDVKDFCVECEVKLVWTTEDFPYPNVQLTYTILYMEQGATVCNDLLV